MEGQTFTHESYGMISYHRITRCGRTRLFGSAIDQHMNTIEITIHTAERDHHLDQDWFHSKKQIVQVELSAAQFAEFLTTGNIGNGVPCTIRRLNGKAVEEPPKELVEAAQVKENFTARCKQIGAKFAQASHAINTLLEGKMGKADRETIKKTVEYLVTDLSCNLPFVLEQFHEATDRIVATAKAEADAFLTNAINRAGLKTLQQKQLKGDTDEC